ncbi:MoaD/ThiS family protein [Coprothermobacteraceae bacterium]|nr:MoaD/ThiS family protein [Coprothermobacteraceae bacterium]
MNVSVVVHEYYRRFGVDNRSVKLAPNSTVEDLLAALGIPAEAIGFAIRNGKVLKLKDQLRDGDTLVLLPFAVGG